MARTTGAEKPRLGKGSWLGPHFAGKVTQLPASLRSEVRGWEASFTCLGDLGAKPGEGLGSGLVTAVGTPVEGPQRSLQPWGKGGWEGCTHFKIVYDHKTHMHVSYILGYIIVHIRSHTSIF